MTDSRLPPDTALRLISWLVHTPPLLSSQPYEEAGDWLIRENRQDPSLISRAAAWLAQQNKPARLGLTFELAVRALLHASEGLQLVAHNVPLRQNGRTLGELDMLVRDHHDGRLWHWELTLKFYLGYGDHWLGPNNRDTLARKSDHLFQRQLPRSTTAQAQQILAEQGLTVCGRALLTRGRLFQRAHKPTGYRLNRQHETGWWCRSHSLEQRTWALVQRDHWPCPVMSNKSINLIETPGLIDYVETLTRPAMVLNDQQKPGFVVPSSWPG